MASVEQHYQAHLALIYVWMAGGIDAALQAGSAELAALNLPLNAHSQVFDLGAGFGMHAIPLARLGARVTAIDSSPQLLATLDANKGELVINTITDDIVRFRRHVTTPLNAVLCMGDTLTHLADGACVERLFREVAAALQPDGFFVLSLRDYAEPLRDEQRFIAVRSDNDRILTCFLEYEATTVRVHDILHECSNAGWQLRVSSYRKLRLSVPLLRSWLQAAGFRVRQERGLGGMIRLVAQRVV